MRVLLSGNVQPWRSKSMPLYRTRLADALLAQGADVQLESYDPVLRVGTHGPTLLGRVSDVPDRVLYQAQRWVGYPAATWLRCGSARADVLHVTDHSYGELARCSRIPAVVTVHDLNPVRMHRGQLGSGPEGRIGAVGWRLFLRALRGLRHAQRIICISQSTRADLLAEMPELESRIRVIWHGVDGAYLNSGLRVRAPEAVMLHVGHNWAYKNVDGAIALAIACHQQLQHRGVAFGFVRAGAPLRSEQIARLQGCGVAYQQYINADLATLTRLYREARVFVFPSLHEGFGWPPLEAMACGTPTVVSRGGALAEVAAPGAEVVLDSPSEFSSEEVAACVRLLTEDRLWTQASVAAQTYAQKFRWSATAAQTMDVYREIV